MQTIMRTKFGSHLYGTDHELSDIDFKGIFLPSKEECFLNQIPKSINTKTNQEHNTKNTKDDIDEEMYSLQYFMKLAINGEMIILDMLHAPEKLLTHTSEIWLRIKENRTKFYSKNLAGYLGYIRKQTAKYGVKGSRLQSIENVLNILKGFDGYKKMNEIWNQLPVDEYSNFVDNPREIRHKHYECCGKMIQDTTTIEYASGILQRMYDAYGERAKMAQESLGVDWKSISHAFRAGYQIKEIYETGNLKYPLKDAPELLKIKLGQYHYMNDGIAEKLENILSEVEILAKKSSYPDKIDAKWTNKFILECYNV